MNFDEVYATYVDYVYSYLRLKLKDKYLIEDSLCNQFPEEKILMEQLVNRLDDTSRQIIYGIYVMQFSCKDLANILNIPEGTVKSKCYYAGPKLKKWLKEESK